MKLLPLALLPFPPVFALSTVNPSDYNVPVHVVSSRLTTDCRDILGRVYCTRKQDLEVVIDGKKLELLGKFDADAPLRTGDYKARTLTDDAATDSDPVPAYEIDCKRSYEFLFPDGKKQNYIIIGETE